MKTLVILLSLLSLPLAVHAEDATQFVCGVAGNPNQSQVLSLEFAGPRYGDAVQLALELSELRQLLIPGEGEPHEGGGDLAGSLSHGSCERGTDPNTLIQCSMHRDQRGWAVMNHSFTRWEKAGNLDQSTRITRRLPVSDFDAIVTRVGNEARLHLEIVTDTPTEKAKRIVIDRTVGALREQDFGCRFQ